jgi:uncharacterized MnhB-related membrane protein
MTAGKTTAQVFGLFGLLATAISLGLTAADVAMADGREVAVGYMLTSNHLTVRFAAARGDRVRPERKTSHRGA